MKKSTQCRRSYCRIPTSISSSQLQKNIRQGQSYIHPGQNFDCFSHLLHCCIDIIIYVSIFFFRSVHSASKLSWWCPLIGPSPNDAGKWLIVGTSCLARAASSELIFDPLESREFIYSIGSKTFLVATPNTLLTWPGDLKCLNMQYFISVIFICYTFRYL